MVINPNRSSSTRSVISLPSKYTNVPPAASKSEEFNAPSVNGPVALHTFNSMEEAQMDELQWSWQLSRSSEMSFKAKNANCIVKK